MRCKNMSETILDAVLCHELLNLVRQVDEFDFAIGGYGQGFVVDVQ